MDDATKQFMKKELAGLESRLEAKIQSGFDEVAATQADLVTLIDKRFDQVEETLSVLSDQGSGHEKRIQFLGRPGPLGHRLTTLSLSFTLFAQFHNLQAILPMVRLVA